MNAELWDDLGVRERPPDAMFAGRDAELDLLWAAFTALETTGARTVLIGGEAGIGKTRLVEVLGSRARAAGALVATGVCTPAGGSGLAFAPVVGVLRDLARQVDAPDMAALLAPARRAVGARRRRGRRAVPTCGRPDATVRGLARVLGRARCARPDDHRVRGSALGRRGQSRADRLPGPQPRCESRC